MIETKPRINRGNRGQLFRATWLSSARCGETFRRTTERVECSAKCTWQWPRTGLNLFQILPTSWRDHEQWTKDPKNVAVVLSERWEKPNHVKKVQHIGSKKIVHCSWSRHDVGRIWKRFRPVRGHCHVHLAEHSTRSVVLLNVSLHRADESQVARNSCPRLPRLILGLVSFMSLSC